MQEVGKKQQFTITNFRKKENSTPYIAQYTEIPSVARLWLMDQDPFLILRPLDNLKRWRGSIALVGPETIAKPKQKRRSVAHIQLAAYHQVKIDRGYVIAHCHGIAFELEAQFNRINAKENLFTGTRDLNLGGMRQCERRIAQYIRETGNHVFYSVAPVYWHKDKMCRCVHIRAISVEDDTLGINIIVLNVQRGLQMDYAEGFHQAKIKSQYPIGHPW